MNALSHNNDTKDDAEMEVKKEVELLVEKAMLEAAANASFNTNWVIVFSFLLFSGTK